MTTFHSITQKMPNGATVADWLGTAALAARNGAHELESVRAGSNIIAEDVETARAYLNQAVSELNTIASELGLDES